MQVICLSTDNTSSNQTPVYMCIMCMTKSSLFVIIFCWQKVQSLRVKCWNNMAAAQLKVLNKKGIYILMIS